MNYSSTHVTLTENMIRNLITERTMRKKLNFNPRYVGNLTEDHFTTPKRKKQNFHFKKNKYLLKTKKIKVTITKQKP